jgi:Fic family protein
MYIWEDESWPSFCWNSDQLLPRLTEARYLQGRFLGTMRGLGFDARLASELEATTDDVVKTSAIEGEVLNPSSVRSSIARRLGIPEGGLAPADRKVDGVVDMILDATRNFDRPLDVERLFGWHAALFPSGFSGLNRIDVGCWRSDCDGPMQVVSKIYSNRPIVHFEAPPAGRLDTEMNRFIDWFNGESLKLDGLLRAGLSHLWFVTIHPFDDGNGRIARAVADLAIAQLEGTGQRLYSMSSQIERDKKRYYEALERTQKGSLDITAWLTTFTDLYVQAVQAAERTADRVVARESFWKAHADGAPLSDRQQKVLRKLLDGFEGFMTTGKWQNLCNCSADTAQRDIADLVSRGIFTRNPGGSKNTSYRFNWPSV